MKNDYTPSENGGLAWLADKGAREAQYDGQGSLVSLPEKERQGTEYERLLKGLYEAALELTGERVHDHRAIEALACFLDGLKQPEAAHQLREGIRDARWPNRNRDAAKSTAKREEGEGGSSNVRRFQEDVRTRTLTQREAIEQLKSLGIKDFPKLTAGIDLATGPDNTAYIMAQGGKLYRWNGHALTRESVPLEDILAPANPPPQDHTAQPPFTEEEIARVRRFMDENDFGAVNAAHCYIRFSEEDEASGLEETAVLYRRLASIAEYLATEEG